nr:hypothetical protein [uncultured Prevotella sp.]
MKKLFTLVFGVLFAMCANAVTLDIGEPNNNTKDAKANQVFFDPATKVITFYKQWDYRPGWWTGVNGVDVSAYDEFVLELDNPDKLKIQIALEYNDTYLDGGKENTYTTTQQGDGDKIVLSLDADHKHSVKQIYLQYTGSDASADAPKTVTFKSAYFQNAAPAPKEAVFFDTPSTVSLGWNGDPGKGTVDIVKASLTDVAKTLLVPGNTLRIEYKKDPEEGYCQVQVMGAWWTILPSTLETADQVKNGNAIYNLNGSGVLVVVLTEADLAVLKEQGGVCLAGHGIFVQKISILKTSTPTGISNATVAPATKSSKIYNLAGQQVDASYKGVVIKNGKKYVQ